MPKKLLIVDDEAILRELIEDEFEMMGYEIKAADRARTAIDLAQEWQPDLILMDVTFQHTELSPDGYEATATLKGAPATEHIPIIIMTGNVLPKQREQAFAAGCDDIVQKGAAGFDDLINKVEMILQ